MNLIQCQTVFLHNVYVPFFPDFEKCNTQEVPLPFQGKTCIDCYSICSALFCTIDKGKGEQQGQRRGMVSIIVLCRHSSSAAML